MPEEGARYGFSYLLASRGRRVSQPLVLAIEDVHWADPSTLEFIKGIAERRLLAPLFLLITARPEFRPPWGMRSHHTAISLAPLDRSQVREMVAERSARHALPKQIVDGVTERTGGVPLFIEEVTRLLLERDEQGGVETIPPTLQQSLMARLDRLGPAREMAQNRGRDRVRLFLQPTARSGRDGRPCFTGNGVSARRGRHRACARCTAAIRAPLQARADPGCSLREFAQEPASGFTSPGR
jgi:hypothetical protein